VPGVRGGSRAADLVTMRLVRVRGRLSTVETRESRTRERSDGEALDGWRQLVRGSSNPRGGRTRARAMELLAWCWRWRRGDWSEQARGGCTVSLLGGTRDG